MAYEIPVTQARAELADLINRVVYGGERVVVTRHGKPLVGLVSAADLERLDACREAEEAAAEEQVISTVSSVRPFPAPPGEWRRFGIAAEHRGTAGDRGASGGHGAAGGPGGPGAGER
ncbi:prevent-host-death protein [Streptomyces sp. CB02923]|uniref:type II toxin-antitoxin system Phd/YefM family antitoxin n=1 Tax=Streptomyces sp. CB02923 TaxID=1718985 RepID=UPI00093A7AD9|nr:type II toxin-antitoxin system Phd/YefM family antitoxin [Streptomyces sp. CB02923]OKI01978.1 prevent-host-death protein [Streptomyces sp. CB02923]